MKVQIEKFCSVGENNVVFTTHQNCVCPESGVMDEEAVKFKWANRFNGYYTYICIHLVITDVHYNC